MSPFIHWAPKAIVFAVTLPFLPKTSSEMLPFLFISLAFTLVLFHFAPMKVQVPLNNKDIGIICMNLGITAASAVLFLHLAGDKIKPVAEIRDTPPIELLYLPLWILIEEIIFFQVHRYAHKPGIYDKCHKWHHHFKVTSAWTSFYAHPLDQLISVVWSALLSPLLMCIYLPNGITAPVVTLFMHGAITTFTGSHHSVIGEKGHALGSDHLDHHLKFNVNFGNFGFFDKMAGSYSAAKTE